MRSKRQSLNTSAVLPHVTFEKSFCLRFWREGSSHSLAQSHEPCLKSCLGMLCMQCTCPMMNAGPYRMVYVLFNVADIPLASDHVAWHKDCVKPRVKPLSHEFFLFWQLCLLWALHAMYFVFNDGTEGINTALLREILFLNCFRYLCLWLDPERKRQLLNSSTGQPCCYSSETRWCSDGCPAEPMVLVWFFFK